MCVASHPRHPRAPARGFLVNDIMNCFRHRRGFTLVELLAVIAIIGLLIALLIPAVQSARATARRVTCSNNLKQAGLAMLAHSELNGAFPFGQALLMSGSTQPSPIMPSSSSGQLDRRSWFQPLLPFVEQQPLADGVAAWAASFGFSGYVTYISLSSTRVPSFMCPDDPNSGKTQTVTTSSGTSQGFHGNYVACSGSSTFGSRLSSTGPTLLNDPNNGSQANGMFRASRPVTAAAILDGLSNTLMLSEILLWPDNGRDDVRGRYWNTLWLNSSFSTFQPPNTSAFDNMECNSADPACGTTTSTGRVMYARSRHSGGVCATLGDGSTRFISDSIAADVYRALGSRNGRETLPTE